MHPLRVEIAPAGPEQEPVLANLLELYAHDLSEYFELSLQPSGRFGHALELLVRFAVGLAFVGYASHMQFGRAFEAFGAVLLVTTLALALLPWRWHRRFAETSVPAALPYLPLIGIASIVAGAGVVWSVASILVR